MKHPPLTPEQQRLVESNTGIAYAVASRWAKRAPDWTDPEELVGEAMTGLCRAAQTWDPAKGAKFSSYAWTWAEQFIRRFLADERGRGVNIPEHRKDVRVGVAGFGSLGLADGGDFAATIAAPESRAVPAADADVWATVYAALPDERWRRVIRLRFVDGWKLDDVGAALGISGERARQIERKALNWLRDECGLLADLAAG